jgi:hypothetical protein
MSPSTGSRPADLATDWVLEALIYRDADGPELGREPVRDDDLAPLVAELWMQELLRKGHPDTPLGSLQTRIVPVFKDASQRLCRAVTLEATHPTAGTARAEFSILALRSAANRGTRRLQEAGVLPRDRNSTCYYRVTARKQAPADPPADDGPTFVTTRRSEPASYLTRPIRALRDRASAVGEVDDAAWLPVFYLADAFRKAEHYARKGARKRPPVESAAVLVGPTCWCPETGEFYCVVTDALEATDAEQTTGSVTFTAPTWDRLHRVLEARQSSEATRGDTILGQAHGHNFRPVHADRSCEDCPDRATCTLTSVFVSSLDLAWSRAVFAHQPWNLCHIFGLTARDEPVHTLFGQREGERVARGFYLVPNDALQR